MTRDDDEASPPPTPPRSHSPLPSPEQLRKRGRTITHSPVRHSTSPPLTQEELDDITNPYLSYKTGYTYAFSRAYRIYQDDDAYEVPNMQYIVPADEQKRTLFRSLASSGARASHAFADGVSEGGASAMNAVSRGGSRVQLMIVYMFELLQTFFYHLLYNGPRTVIVHTSSFLYRLLMLFVNPLTASYRYITYKMSRAATRPFTSNVSKEARHVSIHNADEVLEFDNRASPSEVRGRRLTFASNDTPPHPSTSMRSSRRSVVLHDLRSRPIVGDGSQPASPEGGGRGDSSADEGFSEGGERVVTRTVKTTAAQPDDETPKLPRAAVRRNIAAEVREGEKGVWTRSHEALYYLLTQLVYVMLWPLEKAVNGAYTGLSTISDVVTSPFRGRAETAYHLRSRDVPRLAADYDTDDDEVVHSHRVAPAEGAAPPAQVKVRTVRVWRGGDKPRETVGQRMGHVAGVMWNGVKYVAFLPIVLVGRAVDCLMSIGERARYMLQNGWNAGKETMWRYYQGGAGDYTWMEREGETSTPTPTLRRRGARRTVGEGEEEEEERVERMVVGQDGAVDGGEQGGFLLTRLAFATGDAMYTALYSVYSAGRRVVEGMSSGTRAVLLGGLAAAHAVLTGTGSVLVAAVVGSLAMARALVAAGGEATGLTKREERKGHPVKRRALCAFGWCCWLLPLLLLLLAAGWWSREHPGEMEKAAAGGVEMASAYSSAAYESMTGAGAAAAAGVGGAVAGVRDGVYALGGGAAGMANEAVMYVQASEVYQKGVTPMVGGWVAESSKASHSVWAWMNSWLWLLWSVVYSLVSSVLSLLWSVLLGVVGWLATRVADVHGAVGAAWMHTSSAPVPSPPPVPPPVVIMADKECPPPPPLPECCQQPPPAIELPPMPSQEEIVKEVAAVVSASLDARLAAYEASLASREEQLLVKAGEQAQKLVVIPPVVVPPVAVGGIDSAEVEGLIRAAILKYDADKTGIPDYALESAGGSVLSTRCSETYNLATRLESIWNVPLFYSSYGPRTVIQRTSPSLVPGVCWAFKGGRGYLTIKLSRAVHVTSVSYEHLTSSLVPEGNIKSAPEKFTIYAYQDENDFETRVKMGEYVYAIGEDAVPLQFFAIQKQPDYPVNILELQVDTNHGEEYTCLYRFRVHGNIVR